MALRRQDRAPGAASIEVRRKLLPKWACENAAVVKRAAHDVAFRMRVLNADRRHRALLIAYAERWVAAQPERRTG